MRIQSEPLRRSVEATAAILDAQGKLELRPPSMGGRSLSDLLEDGIVNVNVDPKYPQAMGIAGIRRFISRLGNMPWQILINEAPSTSPFLYQRFSRSDRGNLRPPRRR
jgi:hypothetical protein